MWNGITNCDLARFEALTKLYFRVIALVEIHILAQNCHDRNSSDWQLKRRDYWFQHSKSWKVLSWVGTPHAFLKWYFNLNDNWAKHVWVKIFASALDDCILAILRHLPKSFFSLLYGSRKKKEHLKDCCDPKFDFFICGMVLFDSMRIELMIKKPSFVWLVSAGYNLCWLFNQHVSATIFLPYFDFRLDPFHLLLLNMFIS